jgi:hypothetical protein
MPAFLLAVLLVGTPLLAQGATSASHVPSSGIVVLAAAPASASTTNEPGINTPRSNSTTQSPRRTKVGVLATGLLLAVTILIVACGLALASTFRKR